MRRNIDRPLFIIALVLLFAGLLIVSSASVVISQKNFGNIYYYTLHQAIYGGIGGLIALGIMQAVPYRKWKKASLVLLLLSLGLAALVLLPGLGYEAGGAKRWLNIAGISVQPSEILKFSIILYLSSWLEKKKGEVKGFASAFIPFVAIMAVTGLILTMQRDIGTLIIIVGGSTVLYFLGGGRISQLAALAVLGLTSIIALVQAAPYRFNRFLVFFNPGFEPEGAGYHIKQAIIAIGSGGFFGRGFGQGIQKYNYLPEAMGDSIFAIVVEEFGFLGGIILVMMFFALLWRTITISRRAPDLFGKLLAAGLGTTIALQVFINMAAISGLLPLAGVPLPFISYGGTSLVITMAMVGVILNISKRSV